jgi:hypothetical protein
MNNNTFNIGNFNAENSPVNLGGTIQGDQNATQNNYTTPNPQLESALQDLKNTLAELQQQHPNIATETEAIEIIDGELTNPFPSPTASKLVLLRQQFLNPERHFQAAKATLAEVAKHYLEESVFAKAFITYIDTLSSNPGEGA